MPGLGFVDTAHGPQALSSPDFGALTEVSNQYAAMPSLHIGWSLWCAVVVRRLTPALWPRLLGVLYPVLTTAVIVGTANPYLLDAVGGGMVVAAGSGLRYALAGRTAEGMAPGRTAQGAAGGTAGPGGRTGDVRAAGRRAPPLPAVLPFGGGGPIRRSGGPRDPVCRRTRPAPRTPPAASPGAAP